MGGGELMRIAVYRHGLPHAHPLLEAFIAGLRRHGIEPLVMDVNDRPVDAEVAVFWGHRRDQIIAHQKARGARYLVLERGYVGDRFHWTSCGYDGLNGRADFVNDDVPSDRWDRLFAHHVQPWRTRYEGEYALLLGQVPGDQAVKSVNLGAWYRKSAEEVREIMGLPVKFRPHPQSQCNVPGVQMVNGSLQNALSGAVVAITWNSNSGVEAALAGVPVVTMDEGSMAWPVAAHEIGQVETPDRSDWCRRLGYTQWSPGEMELGEAWAHLRRGLVA